jgi:cytosine/adenosine deaminase-related metal-dependent hydrolase
MKCLSRRNFLAAAGSIALAGPGARVHAAMGPTDKFDLVIKGGDVLDPSQQLRGRRDIGIRYGTLDQVVAMATINPAKVIGHLPKLGTLQVGAPADVAIMELVEGPVSFVDTRSNMRNGQAYLKPVQTVSAGVPFGRPYSSPFSVR